MADPMTPSTSGRPQGPLALRGRARDGRAEGQEAAARRRRRPAARARHRKRSDRQRRLPFATRDDQGRLRVGAAIGATGDYLERAAELIRAGVDVMVIDIAHGHSLVMDRAMREFRKRFGDVELIAGNVATADGARFLPSAAPTASRSASARAAAARPG